MKTSASTSHRSTDAINKSATRVPKTMNEWIMSTPLQRETLSIYCSTVLLLELGYFFSFLILYQTVRLLGRGISPSRGLYLYTEQHKYRMNARNTDIHALGGIRTTIRVFELAKTVHALGHTATVIDSEKHRNHYYTAAENSSSK
jgi:hypothetical protein